ncbi:MAG: coproporphyrinogen III oxidase family protein [Cytophagales bacterium]|nr:coproporphyrinogen III oxidase family protein [Cytophagales bacterium]
MKKTGNQMPDFAALYAGKIKELLHKPPRKNAERVAYLHTPFCRSRCSYCPFYRYTEKKSTNFAQQTATMIEQWGTSPFVSQAPFDIVFFGGGTPTLPNAQDLNHLLTAFNKHFKKNDNCEFTFETTLTHITPERLEVLKRQEVNRLSIGLQTFDENLRKMLGRPSTLDNMLRKIRMVKEAGFRFNLDMMYGLPGQTAEEFADGIRKAMDCGADNISQYQLQLFDDTPLKQSLKKGKFFALLDEESVFQMQLAGLETCKAYGYKQWNLKNFSPGGEPCRYTQTVYKERDMLPLGSGGGGMIEDYSIFTFPQIEKYYEAIKKGCYPVFQLKKTSNEGLIQKKLTGILESGKIDVKSFEDAFGTNCLKKYRKHFRLWKQQNWMRQEGKNFEITIEGMRHFMKMKKVILT